MPTTTPTMRAIWLEGRSIRHRGDVPIPEAPPGEALVRVHQAGICNTDVEILRHDRHVSRTGRWCIDVERRTQGRRYGVVVGAGGQEYDD